MRNAVPHEKYQIRRRYCLCRQSMYHVLSLYQQMPQTGDHLIGKKCDRAVRHKQIPLRTLLVTESSSKVDHPPVFRLIVDQPYSYALAMEDQCTVIFHGGNSGIPLLFLRMDCDFPDCLYFSILILYFQHQGHNPSGTGKPALTADSFLCSPDTACICPGRMRTDSKCHLLLSPFHRIIVITRSYFTDLFSQCTSNAP